MVYPGYMTKSAVRIGLVFGYGLSYYRDIVRGVRAFAEARSHWSFTPIATEPEALGSLAPWSSTG